MYHRDYCPVIKRPQKRRDWIQMPPERGRSNDPVLAEIGEGGWRPLLATRSIRQGHGFNESTCLTALIGSPVESTTVTATSSLRSTCDR